MCSRASTEYFQSGCSKIYCNTRTQLSSLVPKDTQLIKTASRLLTHISESHLFWFLLAPKKRDSPGVMCRTVTALCSVSSADLTADISES